MAEGWQETKARIAGYYGQLVNDHGASPRACDYGRPASQRRKFEVVSEVMPLAGGRILDVGCGLGDFARFLAEEVGPVSYVGVDVAPAMVTQARQIDPSLDIRLMDILEAAPEGPFDLVTANGIFYLLGEDAWATTRRLIERMFALTSHAVAFTTLSTLPPEQPEGEFFADPAEMVRFCQTLTPYVTLRHDYFQHDFTVYLYKKS